MDDSINAVDWYVFVNLIRSIFFIITLLYSDGNHC